MTILENLWYGNIAPYVRAVKHGSEYEKLVEAGSGYEDILLSELSPDGKKAYDEFWKIEDSRVDISECDAFIKGFRLGMKIMLEVLDNSTQLPQIPET